MSDEKTRAQQQFELDFEAFLRDDASQLAELYRKLPLAAPDAELDARVRALAQRELGAVDGDGDAPSPDAADADLTPTNLYLRHPRWLPALGAAAMLVLAAGIAWRMAPSSWSSREQRANAPAAAATTTPTEQKNTLDSTSADRSASGTRESAATSAAAPPAPSNALALKRANSPAKAAAPPADGYARVKTRSDAPSVPPAKPEAQAFPVAAAPQEPARLESEKARSAEVTTRSTPPAPPPPPAPAPAQVEAAPAAASSLRADEVAPKPATPQTAPAAAAGGALHEAARAPKSAAAPQPPGVAANVQSAMATCPVAQDGGTWRGHYPPEIPPTPQLRREAVKDLIGQARRDDARHAYADFHARCPADSWPPDILNQLQAQ